VSIRIERGPDEYTWIIPKGARPGMRTDVIVFGDEFLIKKMREDMTLVQGANVATLPGVVGKVYVMPDGHQGYGFPIGGVAAFDVDEGVISPGGVGYDINCGVRLIRTNLMEKDVRPKLKELVDTLFENIPSGVGAEGKIRVSVQDINNVLSMGVDWAIQKGYGWADDKYHIESRGFIDWANPDKVSKTAKDRGKEQLGTLGAGNHFLEVQVVDKVFDPTIAKKLGIFSEGQVVVMAHCGSRGLGHQVASDYLMIMERAMKKYGVNPPDRELASVPFNTKEAQDYFQAMGAAANFAFTNRQLITHWVRESFRQVFHVDPDKLDLSIIYDVAHNIAKIEEYDIEHQETGQVVLIPGSMGSGSFVMVGIPESIRTFYSAPHGAGRWMSRAGAVRSYPASQVINELSRRGIYVRAVDARIVSEEAPGAYKDVDKVALVADRVKIAKLVARLRPIGVAKG